MRNLSLPDLPDEMRRHCYRVKRMTIPELVRFMAEVYQTGYAEGFNDAGSLSDSEIIIMDEDEARDRGMEL